jgi:protein disulfide-isomerase
MKNIAIVTITAFILFSGSVYADEWTTDFPKALKTAKKERKLILANFTGSDWCGWCIKLEGEVFSKAAFKKWAKSNVILVKIDSPRKKIAAKLKKQNDDLVKKYQVSGFPTILFIDSDGKVVGKSGYIKGGPSAWTQNADNIIKKL